MSLYMGKAGRALLWLGYKAPVLTLPARAFGAVAKKMTSGYYAPGLTLQAYILWQKTKQVTGTRIMATADGFFYKRTNRFLAANPLPAYIPEGAEFNLKYSSPEEIARLFRCIRRFVIDYNRKHAATPIYAQQILPVIVERAPSIDELKKINAAIMVLIDDYAQAYRDKPSGANPSLVAYVEVLTLVLKMVIKEKDMVKSLNRLNQNIRRIVASYVKKHGDPSYYLKGPIKALLGSRGASLSWAQEVQAQIDKYIDRFGRVNAYLELLVLLIEKSRRIEDFQAWATEMDAWITQHDTKHKQTGTVYQYVQVLAVVFERSRSFNDFRSWVNEVNSTIPAWVRNGGEGSVWLGRNLPRVLEQAKTIEAFMAVKARIFGS